MVVLTFFIRSGFVISSVACGTFLTSYITLYVIGDLGIITYIVPCYTAGKNAEGIGEGCVVHGIYSLVPILGLYCHAIIRGKIREQKRIEVILESLGTTVPLYSA